MGAGASAAKYETEAVSQKSVEAGRILQLLSTLGKSEAEENVLKSVQKAFLESDVEKKGLEVAAVRPILEAALKEHVADEADAAALNGTIMASAERNADGPIQLKGLSSIISKKMSRLHTVHCAKEKFDELDADKSGFIDGKEIPQVIDWILSTGVDTEEGHSPEEIAEVQSTLMMRIDVNQDQKISFDEFLVLFEEEQRRGLVKNYATMKFREFDKDRSGFLEMTEINTVVDWLLDLNQDDIHDAGASKEALKQDLLDCAGELTDKGEGEGEGEASTRISLVNFIKLCELIVEQVEMRRRAIQKYLALDTDKSGYLEKEEIYKVVDFMYYNLGMGQVLDYKAAKKELLERLDDNSDGKLDFPEFLKVFEEVYVESKRALAGVKLTPELETKVL